MIDVISPEGRWNDYHSRHALGREPVDAIVICFFELPKIKLLKDTTEFFPLFLRLYFYGDWRIIQNHVQVQFYEGLHKHLKIIAAHILLEISLKFLIDDLQRKRFVFFVYDVFYLVREVKNLFVMFLKHVLKLLMHHETHLLILLRIAFLH